LENDETLQKLIVEKRTLLAEEIEAIKLVVEDYQNEIKELEEDNTSWWDQYELKEEDFEVTFNPPSNFFALREIQMVSQKVDMYNSLAADDMMSKTFLMKKFLGWSDSEILQNRAMAENDAGFRFVLAQCEANGIDWNSKLREQAQGMESDLGGGLGGSGGGSLPAPGGGGDSSLPDFGEPVESPEGGGNTETGGAPETPGQPEQKPEGQ
jgi:hypothetical protein